MSTVYVPQEPSRFDPATETWVPTVNLRSASSYGEINIMLPPNISTLMPGPIVVALKEKMAKMQQDDYLVAIGDPTLIAIAAGIAFKKYGTINLLKWDRIQKSYSVSEIKL